ncbi:DNA/RNA helicase domain-containing protein [Tessaracoccus antarcticus]|uniref:DNA/RNA helicase domain-containing protein n=1 Tax=Tessaracoccus antarcticus TaxID=2479848 RepID=UPI0018F74E78|nr:DNA/RNA helicase domain-containing protein [Tessaracoccus antarcticus]
MVYALDGLGQMYVGESLNVAMRFKQHRESPGKSVLGRARVVVDDTFNKSVCLDLESFLIRLFAGDGQYAVINGNAGITDADYYRRESYQETFAEVFEALRERGLFTQSMADIENSDLFKLSPFKALSEDQLAVVVDIVEGLVADLDGGVSSRIVVQGSPGTGKTIVAIFLIKLLRDIQDYDARQPMQEVSVFDEFFTEEFARSFEGFRVGLVVPQQSLRRSIQRVFRRTPGLDAGMVLSAFDVGQDQGRFDLLIVDEAHRLTQRASQGSGPMNRRYADITTQLFGSDDMSKTQLDWIMAKSANQLFLLDRDQSIRPADVPSGVFDALVDEAHVTERHYRLTAQHRVRAGSDYVGYVRGVLAGVPMVPRDFGEYDLRFFDDFAAMRRAVLDRDAEFGLARLVAGYAWEWVSKTDRSAYDMEIDGELMRWNTRAVDWVNSRTSRDEMGSIHTIQGYDLNVAGVVIGRDLRYDADVGQIVFDRSHYRDRNGKANNNQLGIKYSDEQLLTYVRNIYAVLLTRGIRGTYVYVCDPLLRDYLRPFFSFTGGGRAV